MHELSIKHIRFISGEVSKSGITYSHLLDDLIDHICCDVENEMKNGLSFEEAYKRIGQKIGIDGLQRIQNDTLYLIDKNYRTMKKTMRIFGVLSPILMAFGALFKIEHWPAASILLVLGFFFLSFFFLPSAIYVSYKEISNKTRKWTHIIGFLGTFLLSVSFLFKIQHWPGTNIFLLSGILLTCFVFLPALLIHKLKESDSVVPKYVYVLAYLGFIFHLLGFTFKIEHWPLANFFFLAGIILFVLVALPIYVYKMYGESKSIESSFIYIIIVLALFIIPTTLLSLNVSKNILRTNIETEGIFNADIRCLKERNDLLVKRLPDNKQVLKIKSDVDALTAYIQGVKVDMIKLAEGNRAPMVINQHHEINMQQLSNLSHTGSCSEMMKSGKVKELSARYDALRNQMLAVSNDINCCEIIKGIMPYKLEEQLFCDNATLVSFLNRLTFLQLNIRKAENAIFTELASKAAIVMPDLQLQKPSAE